MAKTYVIYIWKKAPFFRLLLPVIAGIILQYYIGFSITFLLSSLVIFAFFYLVFLVMPVAYRFRLHAAGGIILSLFMLATGMFLTWHKDIRNDLDWYGKKYDSASYMVATLIENPVEKNKSFKALANIDQVINNDSVYAATGKLLLYFAKDSLQEHLQYGSRIIIKKELQPIKNSGNPGAFNYARYCAFQQIFYQCYLTKKDWKLLKEREANFYKSTLIATQKYVVEVINKYIDGKDESALAKALLIGYKIDLDKDLVQAYSNAGVVHLIAISGLHLALIYALLYWITLRIPFVKKSKYVRLVLILFCLWFFALLTGGSASVLRSAVMFSFIATGMTINKNSSIYNSLASSAFVLLCYNPFMLWDVGFQLSYCAVLGIVVAQKNINNWFYFQNILLQKTWDLASVSIAAQLFTLPICLYYFHQMPLLFLVANLIAIPLATLTLWGCLSMVFISPFHLAALWMGKLVYGIIWVLNHSVLFINNLPFSLWDGISISVTETISLYLVIAFFLYWLIRINKTALQLGLLTMIIFVALLANQKWEHSNQKKIIVYNVPAHQAIDFISGYSYHFKGDSELNTDGLLQNFHLKPGRISLLLGKRKDSLPSFFHNDIYYQFYGKKMLLLDSPVTFKPLSEKINVDYIIISKNPKLQIPKLAAVFNCGIYVFDASNTMWKIDKWKKECEELHLHFHSVPEQGAFVTNL